ncbi:elongation factor G [Reichenbachiella sp.]|uniref:elongation factor G n=1 Tax=Reichenbachiella sp. TaxID=2184521 RepID=UPI003297F92C
MKVFDEKHIKNIVLLGSSKSGKTTLAETMLFEAGLINRRGTVENKNTVSDYHEIEHERSGSVYATSLHTEWRNYKINIIDTPGLDDFIGEIASSVRVADTCVFLINAQHGVEVGTELIWNYIDQFAKPTIFVFNQLDHPKSNFEASLESAKNQFGSAVTLMQYPLNEGANFNGIIDLLKMKYYKFSEQGGKPEKLPIPESETEKANRLHNELVEKAAENDEHLMELYFEKGTLDEDEMKQGLKIGMANHQVFPVFCISAKNDMGSGRMMGFIDNVAPSSIDIKSEITEDGNELAHSLNGPEVLFVYKTALEPNLGKMSYFKVISGEVKIGDELINHQNGHAEKINQLFIVDGHKRNPINKLVVGDLGATLKLKSTETNQTLCGKGIDVGIRPIQFPEAKMQMAIIANNNSDDDKLGEVLHKIHQEDSTITYEYSSELKQLLVSMQGELHLAVLQWVIEHIYKLSVEFVKPKIPYRETIQKMVDTSYRHKKQSGGAGQFGEVYMKVEPYYEGMPEPNGVNIRNKEIIELEWGGKFVFYNCIVGGVIDARFLPSIQKGIMEKMAEGPLTGSYVRDVRVMVYDGKMHAVDSNDMAFKIAGMKAFKQAFMQANPKILEPVTELDILVPEDLLGEVMTDLQSRRSTILGIEAQGANQLIKAKTPLAELDKYTTVLRSLTQGRASFKKKFAEYAPVPSDIQEKLIKAYQSTDN